MSHPMPGHPGMECMGDPDTRHYCRPWLGVAEKPSTGNNALLGIVLVLVLVALVLLLRTSPVHATSAEAEALTQAVTATNASAVALKSTSPAEQAAVMVSVVEDIGAVEDYTAACQPMARYVLLLASSWHGAMMAMVAAEPADIRGYLLISIALLAYWGNAQGYVPTVVNECAVGL